MPTRAALSFCKGVAQRMHARSVVLPTAPWCRARRECPSGMMDELDDVHSRACTVRPPLPPQPLVPPSPPIASPSPPLPRNVIVRARDDERDYDPDCFPITYELCQTVVEDYAKSVGAPNAQFSGALDVSLSPCQGLESDVHCFRGCAFGSRGDFTGTYHYLTDFQMNEFGKFNPLRCKESIHPFCACSPVGIPPPPALSPPPAPGLTAQYEYVNMGTDLDPDSGYASGFVRRVAHERSFPAAEIDQNSKTLFECPSSDGRDQCMRHCASHLLGRLRGFTVTGTHVSPPPPKPPNPPRPSRPPVHPNAMFNGCTNTCAHASSLNKCHDGGHGSFYPVLCDYGSSCALCGPRSLVYAIDGDDSCKHAFDGVCSDGGPVNGESTLITDLDTGERTSLCGLGTE